LPQIVLVGLVYCLFVPLSLHSFHFHSSILFLNSLYYPSLPLLPFHVPPFLPSSLPSSLPPFLPSFLSSILPFLPSSLIPFLLPPFPLPSSLPSSLPSFLLLLFLPVLFHFSSFPSLELLSIYPFHFVFNAFSFSNLFLLPFIYFLFPYTVLLSICYLPIGLLQLTVTWYKNSHTERQKTVKSLENNTI